MTKYSIRLTTEQHASLREHLFPGDGHEAVAFLLCGRRKAKLNHILTAIDVHVVPYNECSRRTEHEVRWSTEIIERLIDKCVSRHLALVKVHSHPSGFNRFSPVDDESDKSVFDSVSCILADGLPHASMIMLPDGKLLARVVHEGEFFTVSQIAVIGDDLNFYKDSGDALVDGAFLRNAQAFGKGTIRLLNTLSVAVIGCSGTGSIVAEQLARLGVGKLMLVDPDRVEIKNLNRILNSTRADAVLRSPKVEVLARAISQMGTVNEVIPIHGNLISRATVQAVAECDVVFGCMDGAEGRNALNRLATYYIIPYFDVGVKLEADGNGGIDNISGAVNYLQPGESLFEREAFTMEQVRAEGMRRTNPDLYQQRRREGYIAGVNEDTPAVISVNMFFASLVVNDFLARIHQPAYRFRRNSEYKSIRASLAEVDFYPQDLPTIETPYLKRYIGHADTEPLIGLAGIQ